MKPESQTTLQLQSLTEKAPLNCGIVLAVQWVNRIKPTQSNNAD